jgi:hypothetical protein
MTHQLTIPDPKAVLGVTLLVFGGWLALEAALMLSVGQLAVAAVFLGFGWWFRKRGPAALTSASLRRWMRFCLVAVPVILAVYVVGYFMLMDRHHPTSPAGAFVRFESSFRWAPHEQARARPAYETPWGSVTTWNILYQPMDRFWFQHFPRTQQETEALRKLGYYR